jgi:hypothetical protein
MILDLSVVACRRPDLLGATLESFHRNLFSKTQVRNVFVNIDPAFGSEDDEATCIEIVRNYFSDASIRTPSSPSFGGAVKWLWSHATDQILFHLEDDWVCNYPFDIDEVEELFGRGYGSVVPLTKELGWNDDFPHLTRKRPVKFLGMKLYSVTTPFMGTSPKFIEPRLATRLSEVLMPDLDPEKQQRDEFNKPMVDLTRSNRCAVIHGPSKQPLIRDIGREWREARNIEKTVYRGKSSWKHAEAD